MGMDAENTAQVLGDEMISVEKDRRKQGKEAVKLLLEAFDAEENDRIRGKRIMIPYKVTESGRIQLAMYQKEWKEYSGKISELFEGGRLE